MIQLRLGIRMVNLGNLGICFLISVLVLIISHRRGRAICIKGVLGLMVFTRGHGIVNILLVVTSSI